jgi:tetratricopeptide (TPR) repeat protein
VPVRDDHPLRGRGDEVAVLTAALDHATAGRGSVVALVGEPGIGKSRLAAEAAGVAAARGFVVRWGRAWEAGGTPAYWPWRQVCDGIARDGAVAALWSRRDAVTDPADARFELFDAVVRTLRELSGDTGLLCILDDLHAADVASIELAAFVARHVIAAPLLVVATWRDAEAARQPVAEPLARLGRDATVVSLPRLSDADARALVDEAGPADAAVRDRLVRAADGNPLFLIETAAALATGRVAAASLGHLPIAQAIAAIATSRLAALPADIRAPAVAAAVVGRDVAVGAWMVAAGCDEATVRDAASALVGAGVLVDLDGDRWRFGHDLVREAIYRGAGDPAVTAAHRRLALDADARVAAGERALAGERVRHALAARFDAATIAAWTIAAAEHSRGQCAYEAALAVVDAAIARTAAADPALQLARGQALLDLGDAERAAEAFATAAARARAAGDIELAARAVLGLGTRYVFGDHLHDLIADIDRALADLPATARDLRARLLARKAAALTPAADPAPVLALARRGHAMVAESSDDAARLEVAIAVGAAFADFAHPRERVQINETVVALARAAGDRAAELRGLTRLVTDHIQAGALDRADTALAARDALARRIGQPRFAWQEPLFRSMRAMITGDFATCDAAVAEAAGFAGADPNVARVAAVHRTWLLLHADRVAALRDHEPVVLAAIRTMTPILSGVIRAVIRIRAGELDDARRELAALEPGWPYGRAINILATLAEVVAEVGDDAARAELYDLLAPHADCYAAWGPFGLTCGPPVAAALGQLACARGDLERARAHFDSALAMTTAIGAIVGRAWTGFWLGRALARAGDPAASAALATAAADARAANMPELAARCSADAAPAASAPVATVPSPRLPWSIVAHAGAWQVSIGGRSFLMPDLRGMAMLARLAAAPHVEIHALELVSGAAVAAELRGDAGEHVDARARTAYRKRINELDEQRDIAEARGDARRAAAIERERTAIAKELSRAVGIGGKVRRAGAAGERARIAAQRRLREAIKRIAEVDGELGEHLDRAIRTGTFCAYRP